MNTTTKEKNFIGLKAIVMETGSSTREMLLIIPIYIGRSDARCYYKMILNNKMCIIVPQLEIRPISSNEPVTAPLLQTMCLLLQPLYWLMNVVFPVPDDFLHGVQNSNVDLPMVCPGIYISPAVQNSNVYLKIVYTI